MSLARRVERFGGKRNMTSSHPAPGSKIDSNDDITPRARRGQAARALLAALEAFVHECAADIVETSKWVSQSNSPLGRRGHLSAVRNGILPGKKIGRQVLIRRGDLNSYLERQTVVVRPKSSPPADDAEAEHAAEVAAAVLTAVGLRHRRNG